MWRVFAEEDMGCTECGHKIPSGTVCLSQMPREMPDGFRRRKYENFCIDCAECAPGGRTANLRSRACYVRWLDHGYLKQPTLELTTESTTCDYCGDVIPGDSWIVAQKLYVWPDSGGDTESTTEPEPHSGAVTGMAAGTSAKTSAAQWHNLSSATQHQFKSGGLGRGLGTRSPAMAQRLYEKEVPESIRNLGEPAVRDFLKGKHFSHVKSVANAPGSAKAPSNVVLENASSNLSRGSRNMTGAARAAAESASRVSELRAGAKAVIKGGAKAGMVAAAAEAAVSIPENILHQKRGRKSGEQAAKDAAKSTAVAAGIGIAAGGAASMAGIGLSLGPLGTPLMVAGGLLFGGNAIRRLVKAARRDIPLDEDFPLDEYRIFFCKNNQCRTMFARDITMAAHAHQ